MLSIQSVLFIYMLIGFVCRKKGILQPQARQSITDFLIYVPLPCMVFLSFQTDLTLERLKTGLAVLLISCGLSAAALLLGKVLFRGCTPARRKIMQYGTLISNAGFAGLPVVEWAYGAQGLFLASLFIIPTRIMMWSAGISLFTDLPRKQRIKSVLLNPGILAVEAGILWMLSGFTMPALARRVMESLSGCTTPLAMITVGMILAEIDPRAVFSKGAFALSAIRQIALPLGLLAVLKMLGVDHLTVCVAVVLTGMPVGSTTALLADKYGADSQFGSACVFLSTLTSLATVPLLTLLL